MRFASVTLNAHRRSYDAAAQARLDRSRDSPRRPKRKRPPIESASGAIRIVKCILHRFDAGDKLVCRLCEDWLSLVR
jgi:hypothetical protein